MMWAWVSNTVGCSSDIGVDASCACSNVPVRTFWIERHDHRSTSRGSEVNRWSMWGSWDGGSGGVADLFPEGEGSEVERPRNVEPVGIPDGVDRLVEEHDGRVDQHLLLHDVPDRLLL